MRIDVVGLTLSRRLPPCGAGAEVLQGVALAGRVPTEASTMKWLLQSWRASMNMAACGFLSNSHCMQAGLSVHSTVLD